MPWPVAGEAGGPDRSQHLATDRPNRNRVESGFQMQITAVIEALGGLEGDEVL